MTESVGNPTYAIPLLPDDLDFDFVCQEREYQRQDDEMFLHLIPTELTTDAPEFATSSC